MSMITKSLGSLAAAGTFERVEVIKENTNIAVQYNLTGDPTAVTVDFEGSLDGSTWGVIESHVFSAGELTALSKFSFVVDKPTPYFRLNASTVTFTTAGTIAPIVRYEEA